MDVHTDRKLTKRWHLGQETPPSEGNWNSVLDDNDNDNGYQTLF